MKNRKLTGLVAAAVVLALPGLAMAGVDINVSIPLFGFYAPGPPVYAVPGPPAYYVAPPVEGAVFYGGFWYRPYGGNWFVSAQTGGPWTVIGIERVPYAVISGPVLMERVPDAGYGHIGIGINPWYGYGRGGYGRGHGHGHHDD